MCFLRQIPAWRNLSLLPQRGNAKIQDTGRLCASSDVRHGELEALEIAKELHRFKNIRQLDDDTLSGGERLQIGNEVIGHLISASIIQSDAGWPSFPC